MDPLPFLNWDGREPRSFLPPYMERIRCTPIGPSMYTLLSMEATLTNHHSGSWGGISLCTPVLENAAQAGGVISGFFLSSSARVRMNLSAGTS